VSGKVVREDQGTWIWVGESKVWKSEQMGREKGKQTYGNDPTTQDLSKKRMTNGTNKQ